MCLMASWRYSIPLRAYYGGAVFTGFRSVSYLNTFKRLYATTVRKKFYNEVSIVSGSNSTNEPVFEVCLDKRKLKTPKGKVLQLPNEELALILCHEWEKQKDVIDFATMHMTGLAFTSFDNPLNNTKSDYVAQMLKFLEPDTILYPQEEPARLHELQMQQWKPLIDWINTRFETDLRATTSLIEPTVTPHSHRILSNYFNSYNFWSLTGYIFAINALKSVLVATAVIEHKLTPETATRIASLEQEFQMKEWGRVEWAHDVDFHESCCRVAAGALFTHLCSIEERKLVRKSQ